MSDRQLQLLVQYRLTEADETLREAEILLAQSVFRGSVNRSYYAMFYAVSGLLATRVLGTSKHSGVISSTPPRAAKPLPGKPPKAIV